MSDEMLDNIFKLLEKNKIEQKDFANAIGIKPQVVSDWKSGRNKSYKKYVFQIAEFFHVSTDYLISSGCTESIKKSSAGAEEIIKLSKKPESQWISEIGELSDDNATRLREYFELLLLKQAQDDKANK